MKRALPTVALKAIDFDHGPLLEHFGDGPEVEYLLDYLSHLGATAALREEHYVDRHYLDEFANYYARAFDPPAAHCERYHFFAGINSVALDSLVDAGLGGDGAERDRVAKSLNENYLGFVVRRPLEGATLGRTVLRTYDADHGRRHYPVVRPYRVDICGLKLEVSGLAYQQQDRGAAVCASSALWSALQQVAHLDGQKTPSPWVITQAAGSPYPASHGLDELQMATALSRLGYIADRFVPEKNPGLFRAKLIACLESHLPVVLLLATEDATAAHAVTVTGFSAPSGVADVSVAPDRDRVEMRAATARVLYVHDDNLGSHAHYELEDKQPKLPDLTPTNELQLFRGRRLVESPAWHQPDVLDVCAALVPKPPKLRLPVESLFFILLHLRRVIEIELTDRGFEYRPRFAPGVGYRAELFDLNLYSEERELFHRRLSLPRYVAVLSAYENDHRFLDVVVDVTLVPRDDVPRVLAVVAPGVPAMTEEHAGVVRIAHFFGAIAIVGEPDHASSAGLDLTGGEAGSASGSGGSSAQALIDAVRPFSTGPER